MKVRHFAVLCLSACLGAGPQGCAGCRPTPPATGTVAALGPCDACAAADQLPRARLSPAPTVPLPPAPAAVTPPGAIPPGPAYDPRPAVGAQDPVAQPPAAPGPGARLLPPTQGAGDA